MSACPDAIRDLILEVPERLTPWQLRTLEKYAQEQMDLCDQFIESWKIDQPSQETYFTGIKAGWRSERDRARAELERRAAPPAARREEEA